MSMFLPGASETSADTQRLIDEEVRRIVEAAHTDVLKLLRDHRPQLDDLVTALLKHETLDETDAYAAAGLMRDRGAQPGGAPAVSARVDTEQP
jgi:cell division protease FtsH